MQSQLLSLESEQLQLALADTRAELAQTKRKLTAALEDCVDKEQRLSQLQQRNLELKERVASLEKEKQEQFRAVDTQRHRINELETHLLHRDHLISQLHNRRLMRITHKIDRLRQKIFSKP